jgi:dihydrofolate reductase
MELGIIAAVASNRVIGNKGEIPWGFFPEDLSRFRALTMGHPIIMGRKTYESIPEERRPLDGRLNIVLSRSEFSSEGIYVKESLNDALEFLEGRPVGNYRYDKVYVIGGGEVYREAMPLVDFMEVTKIWKSYEGDVHFPEIDRDEWKDVHTRDRERFVGDEGGYSFVSYRDRRK